MVNRMCMHCFFYFCNGRCQVRAIESKKFEDKQEPAPPKSSDANYQREVEAEDGRKL